MNTKIPPLSEATKQKVSDFSNSIKSMLIALLIVGGLPTFLGSSIENNINKIETKPTLAIAKNVELKAPTETDEVKEEAKTQATKPEEKSQEESLKIEQVKNSEPKTDLNHYSNFPRAVEAVELCKQSKECKLVQEAFKSYGEDVSIKMGLICRFESGLIVTRVAKNTNGTFDIGLCQINSVHCSKVTNKGLDDCLAKLKDPKINLEIAKQIYNDRSFDAWYARIQRDSKTKQILFNVENLTF